MSTANCSFVDCGRGVQARGLCVSHYGQFIRGEQIRPLRQRRPNAETKRSNRDVWLWMMYRLTIEQYDALAANGCLFCGSSEDLVVDHDHGCCDGRKSCGSCVRGVLCRTHNVWLGMIDDDTEILWRAIEYLGGEG